MVDELLVLLRQGPTAYARYVRDKLLGQAGRDGDIARIRYVNAQTRRELATTRKQLTKRQPPEQ